MIGATWGGKGVATWGGKGVATVTDAIGTIACGIAGYRTLAPPDISPH